MASSEAIPFAKTGGLADVSGSLFRELRTLGVDIRLMMPLYKGIKEKFRLKYTGVTVGVPVDGKRHAFKVFSYEDSAFFLECDEFFGRKELYGTSQGDYEDNARRFVAFSRAALESCIALDFMPDVIHANDWQTALMPLYVRTLYKKAFKGCSTLMTIHNLGYQGIFPASAMTLTGLDMKYFNPEALEFYGQMNFLKGGIAYADKVSTVSPNYAAEIKKAEYGFGLEGVISKKDVVGIVNGIDYNEWNPATDSMIPANYDSSDISGKKRCKVGLIKDCSFANGEAPVAGMVGRLASQKGIDLLITAFEAIMSTGVNLAVIGRGEEAFQKSLREKAGKHSGRVFVSVKCDEKMAHRVFAGSDIFLMPSKYEPCGLSQIIAMRYGTVPVARATGGISDTVEDFNHIEKKGSGFLFGDYNPSAFEECVKRALCVYTNDEAWRGLKTNIINKDFSWKSSARDYVELYGVMSRKANR